MPDANRFTPHVLLLVLIAVWGASYVAVKDGLAWCAPAELVAGRFVLATLTLLPLLLTRGTFADLRATAAWGLLAGLLLSLGFLLQAFGMRETSASMGGFLAGLIPLLVAAGGAVFFGARVGRVGAVGLALGFGGLLCLLWPQERGAAGTPDRLRGVLLQVAASLGFAAHVLLLSRVGRRLPTLAFCTWQLAFTALAATAVLALAGADATLARGVWPSSWRLAADLAFLGVLATGVAIALQARVQPLVPPMHVALLFAAQPLFAALAGAAVLGERIGARQALGGAAIVLGIVVSAFSPVRARGAVPA